MNKYSTFNPISKNPYRTHKHGQHIKLFSLKNELKKLVKHY